MDSTSITHKHLNDDQVFGCFFFSFKGAATGEIEISPRMTRTTKKTQKVMKEMVKNGQKSDMMEAHL